MAILEVTRRMARPVTAADVAKCLNFEPLPTQRSLDALADAGLVERMRIGANRREPTYRPLGESWMVVFDPGDPQHRRSVAEISAALRDHVQCGEAEAERDAAGTIPGWPIRAYRSLHLDPEELTELRRLLEELIHFLDAAQSKLTRMDDAQARSVNLTLSLETSHSPIPIALPLPPLQFIAADQLDGFGSRTRPPSWESLSPRERAVAMMLAGGHSRPAVAAKFGISPNTVGTLSKRIYSKLGIRSRAELANRIRRGA